MRSLPGWFSLLCLLILMVAGCKKPPQTSTETQTRDTTKVQETIRLVEVKVPGEKIPYAVQVECDPVTNKPKQMTFSKRGKAAKVEMEINKAGVLLGYAGCDSLTDLVEVRDTQITRLIQENTRLKETIIEHQPRWYDTTLRWLFGILVFLLIVRFLIYHSTIAFNKYENRI